MRFQASGLLPEIIHYRHFGAQALMEAELMAAECQDECR